MKNVLKIPLQTLRLINFTFIYIGQLLHSNYVLMIDTLRKTSRVSPAIVRLDLHTKSEIEIALLSSLISLTPGTLTLSITAEPPTIYVHGMFVNDVAEFKSTLFKFESQLLKAIRFKNETTKVEN